MKSKLEIFEIDNGYLVRYDRDKWRSYSLSETSKSIELMFTQIMKHLNEKNYRILPALDAVRLQNKGD